ncbi:MAG: hypothetical protein ACRD2G_04230 [Terriglobia bacterium]
MNSGITVNKTGWVSTLGPYAERGELFLTEQIVGAEAARVKERMRREKARLVTRSSARWYEDPKPIDRPLYFEPLPEDQVWRFTTSEESWRHLAGRSGYALVRNGVVVCDLVAVMS